MASVIFTKGLRFKNLVTEEIFQLKDSLLDEYYLIKNLNYGEEFRLTRNELLEKYLNSEIVFEPPSFENKFESQGEFNAIDGTPDFDAIPEEYRAEVRRIYEIIKPLIGRPSYEKTKKKIKERIVEYKKENGIPIEDHVGSSRKGKVLGTALSVSSVDRWLRKYEKSGGDVRVLIPKLKNCGGPRKSRLHIKVEEIMENKFEELEDKKQKITNKRLRRRIIKAIDNENRTRPDDMNLRYPSLGTVRKRLIDSGRRYLLTRQGKSEQTSPRKGPEVTRPNQRWEIDETLLDIIVVDEDDRLPIGRPSLTIVSDIFLKQVVGFCLTLDPPSHNTGMSAVLDAILPKIVLQNSGIVKNSNIQWGQPEELNFDQGSQFNNRHLKDGLMRSGIISICLPISTPEWKGAVERHLRTLNEDVIHSQDGTTDSNPQSKGDYASMEEATISMPALLAMLQIYFFDTRANEPRDSLGGNTPQIIWEKKIQEGYEPMLFHDVEELRRNLFYMDARTIQKNGHIEYETIIYRNSVAPSIVAALSKEERKTVIKINPEDISVLEVLNPINDTQWLKFEAIDRSYIKGKSLWRHRINRNYVLKTKREIENISDLADADARIDAIAQREYDKTRSVRRSRKTAARLLDKGKAKNKSSDAEKPNENTEKSNDDVEKSNENVDDEMLQNLVDEIDQEADYSKSWGVADGLDESDNEEA